MLDISKLPLGQRPHRKAYMAKWMADHKKEKSAYDKEYRIKNRDTLKAKWAARHPKRKGARWDRFFGWPPGTHERKLKEAVACDLCGVPFDMKSAERHTDHDHKTGEFRGIIHNGCNRALGLLHESERMCLMAAAYLRKGKNNA